MLTEIATKMLTDSGWPGRGKLSRPEYKDLLEHHGFEALPSALDFLERFEGVNVRGEAKTEKIRDYFNFDLKYALSIVDPDDIADYGAALGAKICPVGQASWNHLVVVVAEDYRVLAYFNPYISLIGRSFDEAINNFCLETNIKRATYDGSPIDLT